MAGGRPGRPRAAPSAANGLTPGPHYGSPAALRETQAAKFELTHTAFCFAKFGGFTGDQQYSPPRYGQNLFLMLLISVARRGRPVGRATESSFAQRGGAAQSGTTPHNSEPQALTSGGCSYPNSFHSGPKARKKRQQNRILRAGRKEHFPNRTLLGSGPAGPEIFWVLLYLYNSTSPGGETSLIPRPPRRRCSSVRGSLPRQP